MNIERRGTAVGLGVVRKGMIREKWLGLNPEQWVENAPMKEKEKRNPGSSPSPTKKEQSRCEDVVLMHTVESQPGTRWVGRLESTTWGIGWEKVGQIIEGLRSQAEEHKLVSPCHWQVSERNVLGLLSRGQMVPSLGNWYSRIEKYLSLLMEAWLWP